MKKNIFLLFFILTSISCQSGELFDKYFINKSLRIDFVLSGDSASQSAALFQLREEPVWGGPVNNLIDEFGYGGYYIQVFDKTSNKLIYSRGFNTLFEEWRSTPQATTEVQAWINSISVPYPKAPVVLELSARKKEDMQFHRLMKLEVDPTSIFIDRSQLKNNEISQIQYKGDPSNKVDLVFIGDGYTKDEQDKFDEDAKRFTNALFKTAPFTEHQDDFNIWSVNIISEDSGTDISGEGIFKNTALNAGFYTFGVDRYLTTSDAKAIRDAVWNVPCDAVFILVNSEKYGGGGMYNFYAIGTAHNPLTIEVFVHELGHSFAGLADEYYTSETAFDELYYNIKGEPWEPNITTLVNFDAKWKDLLPAGTPVPTPSEEKYIHNIGAFEGAGYMAKGIYRPVDHCMMNDLTPFCPVCSRAIKQMILYHTDKKYK
ncbi:IgA Peptidase M64 [Parabacteroides sp. OttesenSCG-928-G07]|nr:IgA Peptidase M64 [Parabacteroides sp. OttesenSCG-928-G21]MDL2277563.1 IgA Peptidase M64 [Parabacteroides sp. OttesenSCG-928-G07]